MQSVLQLSRISLRVETGSFRMLTPSQPARAPLQTARLTSTTTSTSRILHSTPRTHSQYQSPSHPQPRAKRQSRLPASYYRGGTSRAVLFQAKDLPRCRADWAPIFRSVIGSPDPIYGRQLDGMGGGISSLSKICIVGLYDKGMTIDSKEPSQPQSASAPASKAIENSGPRASTSDNTTKTSIDVDDEITPDVDYTFAAVGVRNDTVDYSSNCGNMSAAIGPFAVDSGLIRSPRIVVGESDEGQDGNGVKTRFAVVNIHNTNTGKIIRSTFPLVDEHDQAEEEAAATGPLRIAGVSGTGAPIRLDFLDPAGSKTGKLLPTGAVTDDFDLTTEDSASTAATSPTYDSFAWGQVRATCIDVGNPCVFVHPSALFRIPTAGIAQLMLPSEIEDNVTLMERLESLRRAAAVRMGVAKDSQSVPESVPKIAMVWTPRQFDVEVAGLLKEDGQVCVRALSVGQAHKAVPVTVALALAAAARIPGSVVHECVMLGLQGEEVSNESGDVMRNDGLQISHPTGVALVDTMWDDEGHLKSAGLYSTARRLMDGTVFYKTAE